MRKLKTFIYFFITFIFLSSPIDAKASSVVLTTESLELLHDGIDLLSYSGSIPYGFLPFVFSSEKDFQNVYEDMFSKQDVFTINGQPNIRPLSSNEFSLLENATIYDDEGNIVTLQELYFGEIDNGYFTEKFYCKNDGSIVYQDDQKANPYINVKFGGSQLSYVDWENAYNSLASDLSDNQYHYSLDGSSVGNVSYYVGLGTISNGHPNEASTLFISNQYQPNIVIPGVNSGIIRNWYANDLSVFNYQVLLGNPNHFTIQNGTYNIEGNTYKYYVSYLPTYNLNWFSGYLDYNTWISSGTSGGKFADIGYVYNSNLLNSDVVSFTKVINNADSIDLSKAYSFDSLNDYLDTLEGITKYPNSTFDYSIPISDVNYPFSFDIDNDVSDVEIPFPDSVVVDDTPSIEYPLEDTIDPSLITSNIPIIQGLQNKFPFSIPWDIYKLLNGLSVTRETPSIYQVVHIPIIEYDWEIDLDLSMYNDSAELFRKLFLILFIIGLAVFSYQHFFGS